MNIWWLAGLFFCSLALTGLCRHYALRISMLDIPNARSSHVVPTPRGGGLGVVVTFFIGSGILAWFSEVPPTDLVGVVSASGLVAAIGFADDHFQIPSIVRMTVHVVAAVLFLYVVQTLPTVPWFVTQLSLGWLGYYIAAVSLVWLLNLYNFMDGIDGIAGAEAVSVAVGGIFILWLNGSSSGYTWWLAIIAVAAAGFLYWNRPPARIFMGDVGSGFVGFVFGCFALLTSGQGGINLWTWLILLAVFAVDATVTLVRRILRGERFWQAHRSHAYQILSRSYNSHTKVTVGVLLINFFWLLPWAVLSAHLPYFSPMCATAAVLPLVVFAVKVGAGTTDT